MPDAKVACRQLGFTKTVGTSYSGRGTGKIWLNRMQCSGSESSLGSCPHRGWGNVHSYCNGHTYDVGVQLVYLIGLDAVQLRNIIIGQGKFQGLQKLDRP